MSCLAARSVSTCTTSSMALLEFSSTEWLFTNGSMATISILRLMMTASSVSANVRGSVRPLIVEHHQFAATLSRRGQEQPAFEFARSILWCSAAARIRRFNSSAIVFERDDQHAAPLKYMFAGEQSAVASDINCA